MGHTLGRVPYYFVRMSSVTLRFSFEENLTKAPKELIII